MLPVLILLLTPNPNFPSLPKQDIKSWETRLGSTNFRDRAKAQRELEKLGRSGLPLMVELIKSKDPEVTYRAHSAADKIKGDILASFEPYPQIDTLWYDWQIHIYNGNLSNYQKYSHYLYQFEVRTIEHYYYASKLLFSDLLNSGEPEWKLRSLWMYMHIVGHKLNDPTAWPWSEKERIGNAIKSYIWGKKNVCGPMPN